MEEEEEEEEKQERLLARRRSKRGRQCIFTWQESFSEVRQACGGLGTDEAAVRSPRKLQEAVEASGGFRRLQEAPGGPKRLALLPTAPLLPFHCRPNSCLDTLTSAYRKTCMYLCLGRCYCLGTAWRQPGVEAVPRAPPLAPHVFIVVLFGLFWFFAAHWRPSVHAYVSQLKNLRRGGCAVAGGPGVEGVP